MEEEVEECQVRREGEWWLRAAAALPLARATARAAHLLLQRRLILSIKDLVARALDGKLLETKPEGVERADRELQEASVDGKDARVVRARTLGLERDVTLPEYVCAIVGPNMLCCALKE